MNKKLLIALFIVGILLVGGLLILQDDKKVINIYDTISNKIVGLVSSNSSVSGGEEVGGGSGIGGDVVKENLKRRMSINLDLSL